RIFVDWIEVWTRRYWRRYAGLLSGTIGWLVQRSCVRIPQTAFSMSRLHAERLVAEGYPGRATGLPRIYAGSQEGRPVADVDPSLVVYAGRHIREKRVPALLRAFARAKAERPDLRLTIYGDGPERPQIEALVRELGVEADVNVAGRQPEKEIEE